MGQQHYKETGLYYNRHRYYDPQQGRYITQDPVGLAGGWNAYVYPLDPLSGSDPLGLVEFFKWAGSAVNAASEGTMPYEDATAAIDAANGPDYKPFSGSFSVDVGISLDAFRVEVRQRRSQLEQMIRHRETKIFVPIIHFVSIAAHDMLQVMLCQVRFQKGDYLPGKPSLKGFHTQEAY